ncbi:MAG TPA: hypothetical protein VGY31_07160 [Terriglobia bacterium]|nr:hypothetical protein [Terriglobia bacterium]
MTENPAPEKWLVAQYAPVSIFSLRSTYATSKGGKTLLIPTPYAVKLALVDACFRLYPRFDAEISARQVFDRIKAQPIRIQPPKDCIVQNTFLRVLQPARDSDAGNDSSGPFARTIAYREFVFCSGEMEIALGLSEQSNSELSELAKLFAHINYFGKRGSFWQFLGTRKHSDSLPSGFSLVMGDIGQHALDIVGQYQVTEYLDDFGPKLCKVKDGFERISTYHDGTITLGEHRVLQHTLLPYLRIGGSRHFTHYRRTIPEASSGH